MLKKRLFLVLSSITLVVGGSYFLTGKVIQKNYYETIAKINTQSKIKVNVVSYSRGLISSDAILEVVTAADNPAGPQILPLHQVITHGPIVAVSTPKGFSLQILAGVIKTHLGQALEQNLEESTANTKPLTITTLVKFSNKATTWVSMTAIDQTMDNQLHIKWDTIVGEIAHDLNFANYKGVISFPEIIVNKPGWEFKVNDIAINLDTNHQDGAFYSSNILNTKSISFSKENQDIIKLNDISAKLAFTSKSDNLQMDLEADIANSKIVQQQFTQDKVKFQANYLNRTSLEHLPSLGSLDPKVTIDFVQNLTVNSTELVLELPKPFTEALLSYISFELYRSSQLGRFDKRPEHAVLLDITSSINKLVQGAVKQRLFLDKGTYYSLNYGSPANATQG